MEQLTRDQEITLAACAEIANLVEKGAITTTKEVEVTDKGWIIISQMKENGTYPAMDELRDMLIFLGQEYGVKVAGNFNLH